MVVQRLNHVRLLECSDFLLHVTFLSCINCSRQDKCLRRHCDFLLHVTFSQGSIVHNNISASTDTVSSTLSSINPTQSQCLHRHCGCASSFIRSWASVVLTIAHQNVSASYDIFNSFSTGDSAVSPLKLSLQLSKVAKVPKMQSNSKPNYGKITRSQ